MTKFFLVLLTTFLAITSSAQTTVEIDGVKSEFFSARPYERTTKDILSQPKDGHGILTINSLKEESLVLIGANNEVYFFWLSPGDKIELNAANGESKGGNQKINNFLKKWKDEFVAKNIVQYNGYLAMAMTQKYKDITINDYLMDAYVGKLKASISQQLEELKNERFTNEAFVSYFSDFISNSYWLTLIKADGLVTFNEKTTPPSIYKAILELNIDETILQRKEKSELLGGYIRAHEGLKLIKPNYLDYIFQKAKVIKNEKVREYYVLDELQRLISRGETLFVPELFESSKPLITSAEGQQKYGELYASIKTDEFANKPAVELNAVGLDGNAKKISDFKGKYIYIDVWATWCGPCKQMTPFFMKQADQYKGKNIVFLSLSVDKVKDEQNWKDYVAAHFTDNCVAIWTGSDFKNDFIKGYKIHSIPRFLLIDPQGNIYSSNFWRPNDPRISGLFDKLLEK